MHERPLPCTLPLPQATWAHVASGLAGMGLAGAVTLVDLHLMAALAPALLGVHIHHRAEGQGGQEAPAERQRQRAAEVQAAVAAAAAAEAEAGAARGGAIPHPMQVRSDGAGTVLEPAAAPQQGEGGAALEGLSVIELVDPGRWVCPEGRCACRCACPLLICGRSLSADQRCLVAAAAR